MTALADFRNLLPAEAEVVRRMNDPAALDENGAVVLGDGTLPGAGDGSRRLRADFVRFLCLGGGEGARTPERGMRIAGAWIDGRLDLENCEISGDVGLVNCRFDAAPHLRAARLGELYLSGSVLPGLSADGLGTRGNVVLRRAAVNGAVRLTSAGIGGGLDCDGAALGNGGGDALVCERMCAVGSVYLRGATVRGAARLLGARLGWDLACNDAKFDNEGGDALACDGVRTGGGVFLGDATLRGATRLHGARIGTNLECTGATFMNAGLIALSLEGAVVSGTFFLRQVEGGRPVRIVGALNLATASLGHINDDARCWPNQGELLLDRCRYGAFTGRSPVDAKSRLRWLGLQDPARFGLEFWPQPYEQLARVLREAGHGEDAREVLIEKEKLQRRARRGRLRSFDPRRWWLWFWDMVLGATVRYGRQPLLAFAWLLGVGAVGWAAFDYAAANDAIKPNNAVVLRAPEWVLCGIAADERRYLASQGKIRPGRAAPGESQRDCFARQPEAASYPAFNALVYSADTLLPIVDLEMQRHWIPDEAKAGIGVWARAWLWAQIALGWALSLLAVAGFSGLVKSD